MYLNEGPMLKCGTEAPIVIHNRRQENEKKSSIMSNTEINWEWQDPIRTWNRSQEIKKTARSLVACDYGFEKNLASSQITWWIKSLDGYLDEGKDDTLSPIHFGSNAYLENIESR